eukprot:GHUV01031147.1.p1 GENE.GHUV01031147.1~~GHUV01031147.1.p1  ORF type:complete len:397 (+),score=139.30 GHUV01031147.1:929-2119(+)
MGSVALEIRAAIVEQRLVLYEMKSLLSSYRQDIVAVHQALDAAEIEASAQLQQQDLLMEQVESGALSQQQQHSISCSSVTARDAAKAAYGRRVLLFERQSVLQSLLSEAAAAFAPHLQHINTPSASLSEQQLMAAADEIVLQAAVDAGGDASDDPDDAIDDEADLGVDLDQADSTAAAPTPGSSATAAAAVDNSSSPEPVGAVPFDQPVAAADAAAGPAAVVGPPEGLQLWDVVPDVEARYTELCQQLQALTAEQLDAFAVPNSVSKRSLLQLLPECQLNDEVMNEMLARYLRLNQQLSTSDPSIPGVHIFNTFFMDQLWLKLKQPAEMRMKLDYLAVHRQTWPKKLAISGQLKSSVLDCHLIIVPCHLPGHWVVVVADLKQKRITYIDPLMVGKH